MAGLREVSVVRDRTTGLPVAVGSGGANLTGNTIGVSFPGQAIWQDPLPCEEVIVQNDPASAVNVTVGNEFGQYLVLIPGDSVLLHVNDVNLVWAGTSGGSATVNWLAITT